MANLRDFNASSNSSNLNTDTVEWNVSAFTISSPHDDHAHPTETQLSIMVKCAILIPVVFIGISGNILTLVTIRTTPRLWTKTNVFLASLAVADVFVAATLAYYVAYQLLVYIFINPCYFIRMIAVITPIQTFPLYVSVAHLGVVVFVSGWPIGAHRGPSGPIGDLVLALHRFLQFFQIFAMGCVVG